MGDTWVTMQGGKRGYSHLNLSFGYRSNPFMSQHMLPADAFLLYGKTQNSQKKNGKKMGSGRHYPVRSPFGPHGAHALHFCKGCRTYPFLNLFKHKHAIAFH